ncbi:dTMP kinase [Kitasatospora sp. NPDC059577]|uniref:dTMP kinase n=1 Tax=Kitasatospora sp. NPDC059577 TaxID=3346873 RepID=UPI0036AA59B5
MAMTETPGTGRGMYVGILGLDGSGKTTVAHGLTDRLTEHGYESEFVRWRDIAAELDRVDFPHLTLRQLLVETWRTRYGGATDESSLRVQHGPRLYEDFTLAKLEQAGSAYPVDVRRSGVLASALLEFVADMLIQAEFFNASVARGRIVVTDSYGYKNIIKVLRVANEIPSDDISKDLIARVSDFISDAYSSHFMQPDIGVFLRVTPEECYKRVTAQRGGVGPVEDMGFAGRTGRSSFLELQSALLAEYEQMAADWGWHVLDVDGATPAEVLDAVNDIVVADVRAARRADGPPPAGV